MRQKDSSLLCVVIVLVVTGIVLALLFLGTHTDHSIACPQSPDYSRYAYYRPIESADYGTAAGTAFSRTKAGDNYDWSGAPDSSNVSAALQGETTPSYSDAPRVSNLFWVWGQFLAHSIALSEEDANRPAVPIGNGIPPGQPTREIVDAYGVAQQLNSLSPYLDASAVYGSAKEDAWRLRLRDGSGRLRTSAGNAGEELLPLNAGGEFEAGDVRARENTLLSAMHALWVREHNWWCARLHEEHKSWRGDRLYNTARHLVAGEIQSITYNEWLPLLIGTKKLDGSLKSCYHHTYATVRNEFATAAFRFGHSLVTDRLEARDPETGERRHAEELSLLDSFFQHSATGSLVQHGADAYLLGASRQRAEPLDGATVEPLRAISLTARNIARGRQHGLPSFQQLHNLYGARPYKSHHQLTDSPQIYSMLCEVYGDWSSPVDLWVGVVTERKRYNALLGEVGARLMSEQFELLRESDPYYYMWDRAVEYYRPELHSVRLSAVLLRNTRISKSLLLPNVFMAE